MMMSHPAHAAIEALDLVSVRMRLLHPRAGLGWSEQRARNAEAAYREFLFVAKLFPSESPVPSGDVDSFWHFHILDTIRYARDCASIFGHFLHHAPDTAARHDAPSAARAAMTTNRMVTLPGRGQAANQRIYEGATVSDNYCAVAQGPTQVASSYCAITQSSAALADGEQSYCALTQAPKPSRMTRGALP